MKYYIVVLIFLAHSLLSVAQPDRDEWPVFRGRSDLSGNTLNEIPDSPVLLWSFKSGVRSKSSPVAGNSMIFFGDDKGNLTAVGSDGKMKWKSPAGNIIEAPAFIWNDKVIIGSTDGNMRAFNKNTGTIEWTYSTENQILGSANTWMVSKRSGLIFGSYDYYLHCVDPSSGKYLWKLETNNYVNGTPAVSGNNIVFGGCDGIIRIVDPVSGREKDTVEIGTYIAASPALAGGKACFGDYDGILYCVDLSAGKLLWETEMSADGEAIIAIPAIAYNSVIIGSEDKYLYCFDLMTGKLKWKYRTNGRITGSAVITPGKVLFGSTDGFIHLLELKDGEKIWSFNAGAPVSSSPAVAEGKFYFLTEDGRLLAFGKK